jgi:hypothetical protein
MGCGVVRPVIVARAGCSSARHLHRLWDRATQAIPTPHSPNRHAPFGLHAAGPSSS